MKLHLGKFRVEKPNLRPGKYDQEWPNIYPDQENVLKSDGGDDENSEGSLHHSNGMK